jgi:hypothetical protein
VGAGNLRYFLLFLLTLIAMCANGMLMALHSLMLVVRNLRLMESSYVDHSTGNVYPVTYPVLLQVCLGTAFSSGLEWDPSRK